MQINILGLQRIFVRRRTLIRGAIAIGKHYADANLVYSEAVVRAYRLERDRARFPRVLIDSQLLDWYVHDTGCAELKSQVTPALLKDRDEEVFLHYLGAELLEDHGKLIGSYEPGKVSASVLEKIQWLAAYHNHVATTLGNGNVIDGPLVAGFQPLAVQGEN